MAPEDRLDGQGQGERQQQAGHQDAGEELADADSGVEAVDHQHDAGRDHHAEGRADGDAAALELGVVAGAGHGAGGDGAHRRGSGRVRAADGREAGRGEERGRREPAASVAEPCLGGMEEAVAVAGLEDDLAQQHEERDHGETVVGEDAPNFRTCRSADQGAERGRRIERQQPGETAQQHRQTGRHAQEEHQQQHDGDAGKAKDGRFHHPSSTSPRMLLTGRLRCNEALASASRLPWPRTSRTKSVRKETASSSSPRVTAYMSQG